MKTIKREEFEEMMDNVDAKNTEVDAVKKVGDVSKTVTYTTFWRDMTPCDDSALEVIVELYTPFADPESHVNVEDSIVLDADDPTGSVDFLIQECDDVLNVPTLEAKALALGFDTDTLARFPMDVDTFYLLRKKYLTDLKAELDGKCFDLSDKEDWENYIG